MPAHQGEGFTFDLLLLGMVGQDAECMEILEMTKKFLPELDIMLIADDMGFFTRARYGLGRYFDN